MSESIVIIGSKGFVGNVLVSYLKAKGFRVITISRNGKDSDINLDITNKDSFKELKIDPQIVINCASMLPNNSFWDEDGLRSMFEVNFWGSYNIAQWVKRTPSVKQVINLSTLAVYNKPWSIDLKETEKVYPYAANQSYVISKLNQELVFKVLSEEHDVQVANLRLSAIFGEQMKWNGILCTIIDKALNKEPLNLVNGELTSFDFLHVNNVCEIIEKVIFNKTNGIVNVASGNEVYLLELAQKIYEYLGLNLLSIENVNAKGAAKNRAVVNVDKIQSLFNENYEIDFYSQLYKLIEYRNK
jgi:UDP-glucose 4-epimerase